MKPAYWMLDGNVFFYEESAIAYAQSVGKKTNQIKTVQIIWDNNTYLNEAQAQIMNPTLQFIKSGKDGNIVGLTKLGDFVIGRHCVKQKGSEILNGDAHMRLLPTVKQEVLQMANGVN